MPAYINEYVSAPADWYQRALVQVRGGLIWINVESNKRFGKAFADVTPVQRTAICDDICYAAKAKPEFKQAAQFFDRVRDLTAEGFYTTDEGMKDIGYVGTWRSRRSTGRRRKCSSTSAWPDGGATRRTADGGTPIVGRGCFVGVGEIGVYWQHSLRCREGGGATRRVQARLLGGANARARVAS
ncbi:MAG: gluconate 2-dehydrogenase subunit 3 family protein [Gemmatimonadetes bacterium]|nr:gluconate 2-dehydrogenase subunit 3 family protein [Gemmatimonadota bacterium]